MYKCVMVITLLYTYTGTEIGTKIGRYGGTEIERYEAESRNGKIYPQCPLSGVCGLVGLLWLSGLSGVCWLSVWLVRFRFFALHKKIF